MSPAKVHEFFTNLRKAMPDPKSELEHASPFELLVAVILSAQATDKGVNLATRKLFPVANTPEKIAKMGWLRLLIPEEWRRRRHHLRLRADVRGAGALWL